MNPEVSIIICTKNRCDSLKRTLRSIKTTRHPSEGLELLIVDNGSTDHTQNVATEEAAEYSFPVRVVCEQETGLSAARNRALEDAKGEILLFTDDDVLVSPDWVCRMIEDIRSGECDAVAGGIEPGIEQEQFLQAPYLVNRRGWFACTSCIRPGAVDIMFGANMAFHRRVLNAVPCFDLRLGAGKLGFYEEVLFAKQLARAGFRIKQRFDIKVVHLFDLSRVALPNLLVTARRLGSSRALMEHDYEAKRIRFPSLKAYIEGQRTAFYRSAAKLLPQFTDSALHAAERSGYFAELALLQSQRGVNDS